MTCQGTPCLAPLFDAGVMVNQRIRVLLILTTVTVLVGCGGSDQSSTPVTDLAANVPPSRAQQSPVHEPLKAGSTGRILETADKIHEVHIVEIMDNAQSTEQREKPADGSRYRAVRIGITNAGTAGVFTGSWTLVGFNDTAYPRTVVMGIGEAYRDLQSVQPGSTASGTIVFEIPTDVSPKQLRYDPDHLAEADLYFDA
jgi:hypothetical protein